MTYQSPPEIAAATIAAFDKTPDQRLDYIAKRLFEIADWHRDGMISTTAALNKIAALS